MKVLSLARPWDQLIMFGGKNIENRTWNTTYRWPLLVHGAKSFAPEAVGYALRCGMDFRPDEDGPNLTKTAPTGILGLVDLVGVCRAMVDPWINAADCRCGKWAMPMQYHWQVVNPRPFAQPIPVNGRLGLWTPDTDLQEQIDAALAA